MLPFCYVDCLLIGNFCLIPLFRGMGKEILLTIPFVPFPFQLNLDLSVVNALLLPQLEPALSITLNGDEP